MKTRSKDGSLSFGKINPVFHDEVLELKIDAPATVDEYLEFRNRMMNIKIADSEEEQKPKKTRQKSEHKKKKTKEPSDSQSENNDKRERSSVPSNPDNQKQPPSFTAEDWKKNLPPHLRFDVDSPWGPPFSPAAKSWSTSSSSHPEGSSTNDGSWITGTVPDFLNEEKKSEKTEKKKDSEQLDQPIWTIASHLAKIGAQKQSPTVRTSQKSPTPVDLPIEKWEKAASSSSWSEISFPVTSTATSVSTWDDDTSTRSTRSKDSHQTVTPFSWRRDVDKESVFSNAGSTAVPALSDAASQSSWGGDSKRGEWYKPPARSLASIHSNYHAPYVEDVSDSTDRRKKKKKTEAVAQGDKLKYPWGRDAESSVGSSTDGWGDGWTKDDKKQKKKKKEAVAQKEKDNAEDAWDVDADSGEETSTDNWGSDSVWRGRDNSGYNEDNDTWLNASTPEGLRYRVSQYSIPGSWKDV